MSQEEIEYFAHEPPKDTRAWTRAMVLRRFAPSEIERIDWDYIDLRLNRQGKTRSYALRLDDPLGFTRESTASFFESDAIQRKD